MSLIEWNRLIQTWSKQYQYIFGKNNKEEIAPELLVGNIVHYYEDVINCMPGNVYWLDENGMAIGCNKNVLDMFGLQSVTEFAGLSFEKMGKIGGWTTEATEAFKNDTLAVIQSGIPKLNIEEPPIPHKDGRIIYFLTSRVPLFNRTGNVIGMVGISIDITELKNTQAALKKAKEQAETASQAKSAFLANMSHDIKTPLSGVIGISEILTHRLHGENQEFTQTLLSSSRQLLNFFNNCLEIFKMDHAEVTLITERFNLQEVLHEIKELFQPAISAKKLMLNIFFDDATPTHFIGSRAAIYRILLNLVGNAVKFTTMGSISIQIKSTPISSEKHVVSFVIEDTGIGIPKDKQAFIFEQFARITPSYKGSYEGSGIGLYIVQKFLAAIGGEIFVESEEKKGSRFTITLPLQAPLVTENSTEKEMLLQNLSFSREKNPADKKSKHKQCSPKVLLIEDDVVSQLVGSTLLSTMQCHVDVASSGENALELFDPGKYDLILMDMGLPDFSGDAVAKSIRQAEKNSPYRVPIIALTAHLSDETHQQCLSSGMDGALSKPLSYEKAEKIIHAYATDVA